MELLVQVKQYQQNVSLEREKKKNAIYQICLFEKKKSLCNKKMNKYYLRLHRRISFK